MFLENLGPKTSLSVPNWWRDCRTIESITYNPGTLYSGLHCEGKDVKSVPESNLTPIGLTWWNAAYWRLFPCPAVLMASSPDAHRLCRAAVFLELQTRTSLFSGALPPTTTPQNHHFLPIPPKSNSSCPPKKSKFYLLKLRKGNFNNVSI